MIGLEIENITFTAKLAEKINIEDLAEKINNSKYKSDEFSGLIIEINKPKCAVFLFPNGSITCTGVIRIEDIELIVNHIINEIEIFEDSIYEDIDIKIKNIIASSVISEKLDFDFIKTQLELKNIENNEKYFPGLIYNIEGANKKIIFFESGKIIFTGYEDLDEIKKTLNMLKNKIINNEIL